MHRLRQPTHARALVALLVACALLAWCSAAAAAPAGAPEGSEQPADLEIYVPVDDPVIKDAPMAPADTRDDAKPDSATEAASQAMSDGVQIASKATEMKLGGAIPVWWLLLGGLAIPFALLWRRWTAQMFA